MFVKSSDESVHIRVENPTSDVELEAIRMVNRTAFGGSEEAELVDKLRDSDALVSLVAESELSIVGHIMLSRMWIRTTSEVVTAVALAPVAVLPDFQRQGIGARLIDEGLARMKQRGERIVIVVGHPSYYPRFGFSADKAVSLESPFPPEAFMALELVEGSLTGVRGPVVYPPAFGL